MHYWSEWLYVIVQVPIVEELEKKIGDGQIEEVIAQVRPWYGSKLCNFRLLMRCTHDLEDHMGYWLTKAEWSRNMLPKVYYNVLLYLINYRNFFYIKIQMRIAIMIRSNCESLPSELRTISLVNKIIIDFFIAHS